MGLSTLFADDSNETNEEILARVLKQAVSIFINSKIIRPEEGINWESEITKVTVPGRPVTLMFEGENIKLYIELTPFRVDNGSYLLAALSSLWIENDDGAQFKSSYKRIELNNDELILFYPLGRATQEALTGGSIYLELGIKIIPYIHDREEQSE